MNLIWTKVVALSLMIVIALTAGLLPLKLRKIIIKYPKSEVKSRIFLSASLCFGAGVLLATVFLHLFPETLENVETAQDGGFILDTEYPIGEIVLCCGFFLMYSLEELVHFSVHWNQNDIEENMHSHLHHHHHHENDHNDHELPVPVKTDDFLPQQTTKLRRVSDVDCPNHRQSVSPSCRNKRRRCKSLPTVAVLVGCDNPVMCTDQHTLCINITEEKTLAATILPNNNNNNDLKSVNNNIKVNESTKTFRSVLIMLALSIHGCLEGLALGLEDENKAVWMLFLALTAHKIAIAISIGMELLEKDVKIRSYIIYMLLFSLASPFGGLIGALVKEYASTETASGVITVMILQGLSGGTILFIIFCEVLERERCKTEGRIARLIALIVGFLLIACLELINFNGMNTEKGPSSEQNKALQHLEGKSKQIMFSISSKLIH